MAVLSAEHWALLAGFLAIVGLQLVVAAFGKWQDPLTAPFVVVCGLIVQLAILLRAMFTDPPADRSARERDGRSERND